MNRFWDMFVSPLLYANKAKNIVEIGAAKGENTKKILEYCVQQNAVLSSIDPAPVYDYEALRETYGSRFQPCLGKSLQELPKLDAYDTILIDGDHNWYTVYHELKLVERHMVESGQNPLILFHDLGWPYGRRDAYYDPSDIPDEYRQPYAFKGMLPGVSQLVESGGLNDNINNALAEGGPRNGGLTAVEDFMAESSIPFRLIVLNGANGLGIMAPLRLLKKNKAIKAQFDSIDVSNAVQRHLCELDHTIARQSIENAGLRGKLAQMQALTGKLVRKARRYSMVSADITNYCNARCVFCVNSFSECPPAKNIEENIFEKLIQILPYTREQGFFFSCLFEPSIHPRYMPLLSKLPREEKGKCLFTTNLIRPLSDEDIDGLAKANVEHINLSLETFDPALYQKLLGVTNSSFFTNLDRLCAAFAANPNAPRIRIITMVLPGNYDELPALAKKVKEQYHPDEHEFRVPYLTFDKNNQPLRRQLLAQQKLDAMEKKLLSVSDNIRFYNEDGLCIENMDEKLANYNQVKGNKRFSYGDAFTLRVNADGSGEFFGDGQTFDLHDVDDARLFFSRHLTQLQEGMSAAPLQWQRGQMQEKESLPAFLDESILYDGRFLSLSGWAVDTAASDPFARCLLVEINRKAHLYPVSALRRDDVAQIMGAEYLHAGFTCLVDLQRIFERDIDTLKVAVVVRDDEAYVCKTVLNLF